MFKNQKDFVAVSFVDDCYKLVHFRSVASETQIIAVAKKNVQGVALEDQSGIVRGLLGELGLGKISAVYALSAKAVTTKNIEVPSIDPAEIKSIIDLQAGRHTPYSREEILVGYIVINVFQRNYTKVLLVIVNRDQLLKQLSVLVQAGLRIEKVVLAPEGAALWYSKILKVKADDGPVGIIDVSHQSTDFMVAWSNHLAASRSIPAGLGHLIREGQSAVQKFLDELVQSMEVYQNEDIAKVPDYFIIPSDDPNLQGMQTVLTERLKSPVKFLPYLDQVKAGQPVMLKLISEYNDDSFMGVIAVGLTYDDLQLDLTPDEIRAQRDIEEKGKQIIGMAICGLVILVLVCAIFFSKIYFRSVYLDQLKMDYEQKQKIVTELSETAQRTRIVKDFINGRLVTLDMVKALYRLVPNEMYLQSVTLDEDGTILVQGVSDKMSLAFDLVTALEESELFKAAKIKSTSTKQERGQEVAIFEIGFRLESAPDEEAPEDSEEMDKTGKEKTTVKDEKKPQADQPQKK